MKVKLPKLLKDFLIYLTTIKGKSPRTRKEYQYDLVLFLRYYKSSQDDDMEELTKEYLESTNIHDINIEMIREISLEDIFSFLEYCEVVRNNSAHSRARKVASIKSFFKYLSGKRRLLEYNPAEELESPKIGKKTPIYLNIQETKTFLGGIQEGNHYYRNTCIITFFLNLGLRVSELCSLNLQSIHGDSIHIIGKGNKERTIFLNKACLHALDQYTRNERCHLTNNENEKALFLSQKRSRISRRSVERIVASINKSLD